MNTDGLVKRLEVGCNHSRDERGIKWRIWEGSDHEVGPLSDGGVNNVGEIVERIHGS